MKRDIRITEVLSRVVSVNSDSIDDAILIVEDMYYNQEIILDDFDYHGNLVIEKKEDNFQSKKDFLMNEVLEYFLKDEKKHYEELGEPSEHIYLTLLELQKNI